MLEDPSSFIGQLRLVENVTFQYVLNDIAGPEKENPAACGEDVARQLTVQRERQLAEGFAYIAATTDDMYRVMGVCIEEYPDQRGITVRLASNTGDSSNVVAGLRGTLSMLENAKGTKIHFKV